MAEEKKEIKKEKEPDITFFHPDLLEIPKDGSPPYLKGYRCKKCGQIDFPKLTRCPKCWGEDFEIFPLSRRGRVYSFADVSVGQAGMSVPYTISFIDLPEKIRIFAQLEGETKSLKCGDEMELTVATIRLNRDGLPMTSYKFKKVN
jgi:benzoylsuccinyl-CoA thiolase BbsA subunit